LYAPYLHEPLPFVPSFQCQTGSRLHPQNYSANTGDLHSFLTHLRQTARERGVDLLLIDSGDHHDGSGLVSSSSSPSSSESLAPSGARFSDHILSFLSYDVLTIGNHELYKYPDTLDVESDVRSGMWDKDGLGRYLSSNVNITLEGEGDGRVGRPVGERVIKFKTEM
jgi:2',3'-cyclic-nucleotide 2'-phosphodiesterase (5'-nucleotidase family)